MGRKPQAKKPAEGKASTRQGRGVMPAGALASRSIFFRRLRDNLVLALGLVGASLAVGMLGYHFLAGLAWVDAFLNAAMILSGMGPVDPLTGDASKLFAGVYAIYSGLTLVATAGLIIAPIIHRFLHRFHLEDENDES